MALAPLVLDEVRLHADRAYDRLRDAIVDGVLHSGHKLSERGLAAALAMSAQPVREAMRRLESEGLIETRYRSGTHVARLDDERLMQMGRIRAAMEAVSAGIAASSASGADIDAIGGRLAAIREITRKADAQRLAEANDAFHRAIHLATGNTFLLRSMQALRAYFLMTRGRVLAATEQHEKALAEHTAIFAAIEARDAEAAEARMRAHALRSLSVAFPQAADTSTETL